MPAETLSGRCHCTNVQVVLETTVTAAELELRADTCSFCRRHGARTTSDPRGRATITVRDPATLVRYRFGLRTADFLVCGRCGIYVAAVVAEGDRAWATVNVNVLDAVDRLPPRATPVGYDAESAAERVARRKARWTPAVVLEP